MGSRTTTTMGLHHTHVKHKKYGVQALLVLLTMVLVLSLILPAPQPVYGEELVAVEPTTTEDGGIKQHELFEFEAFIKDSDIKDGNGPFDADNEAGNDGVEDNKIIRTFDTMTYPLKITVNPKKEDMLKNIKFRISGTLENGVTDNRINAKFSVGGTEDLTGGAVSFIQDYTIAQTGNSIMIPIAIEVQGAKHGVKLTPKMQVQVLSVDGVSIENDNVIESFDNLPGVTTSAKVSIKPYIGSGLAGQGLAYFPYAGITGNEADKENMHAFGLSWGIANLPGKTNVKGATFPDSQGKINYEIKLSGSVAWDNPAQTTALDFTGQDTPFMLLDQRPISNTTTMVGSKNTLLDGISYTFSRSGKYSAPMSNLPNLKQSTIDQQGNYTVWDSGDWEVDAPSVQKNAVVYTGTSTDYKVGSTFPIYRADGYSGGRLYGVNDRIFASNSFLVKMPNEYRIGGPNNADGRANNVNYRADIKMVSYTDEFGVDVPFTGSTTTAIGFTERNNPSGAMSVNHTFFGHPSGSQLGTPVIGNSITSKGDASTIIGEDVRIVGYFIHTVPLAGGYTNVHRWNPEAFEMTKAYATWSESSLYNSGYYNYKVDTAARDYARQKVSYGVAKFTDFEFKNLTSKGKDDYNWYDTYDAAIKTGAVSAIKNDVNAFVPPSHKSWSVPVRVKHENIGIGSATKTGTANISITNTYAYMDENRTKEIDVSAGRAYHNPAIWDENGNMLQKQSPSGGAINFDTIAITPAQTATNLTSDKQSYYNSETINWTAKSSIVLPASGVPDNLDAGVTIEHVLPRGLDYKPSTGMIGGTAAEPEIRSNPDGTKSLLWSALVSNANKSIPEIKFQTTINPFALSGTGVQSSVTVTSIVESELDQRKVHLRTSTTDVTVLKVGMVGIYESISKLYGDKESEFVLTLTPYTTIEDEYGVTGLTVIPLSGDELGSAYSGSAAITAIGNDVTRVADDPVHVFLNRSPIYSDKPHEIDPTVGGWYKYTGDPAELIGAVSVLFQVEGKMTNKDAINLNVTVKTADNEFGDTYLNETVINSATDYRLSPISNRVRYNIRADLELALERIQIFTDKASKGLPVSVRVRQTVLDPTRVKDENITLALYDTDSGAKITEKSYKQSELVRENALLIPPADLVKAGKENYEVRIEGFNDNLIWVKDGEGALDTDGHTSTESTLTNADKDGSGVVKFTGVTMTEREFGRDMAVYTEILTVNNILQPRVKAGYGFPFDATVTYTNPMMNDAVSRTGMQNQVGANLNVDNRLLDKSVEYYDEANATNVVPLDALDGESPVNGQVTEYRAPQMYLEQGTGNTYTSAQRDAGLITGIPIDAGYKLYVPIWMDEEGKYDAAFQSTAPIGSHHMSFDLMNQIDVYGFMFSYVGSPTSDTDELLIVPMPQSELDAE